MSRPDWTPRELILSDASALVSGDRERDYGAPSDNFATIAAMWSAYLGHPVRPDQVACCMALLKVARLKHQPTHRDSHVDGCGYLALAGELA